jgi:LPS-assembly protein
LPRRIRAGFLPSVPRRLLLLLALLCAAPAASAATPPPVELSGDTLDLGLSTGGNLVYRGNARVTGDGFRLAADEIRLEGAADTFHARGRVVLTLTGARLLADELTLRRRDGRFEARQVRLGSPPYFATATEATGTRAEVTLREAQVSLGEPGPWQPSLTAAELVVLPGKGIRTAGAAFGVGDFRPFVLRGARHDFDQPLPLSLGLGGGFRRSLGLFGEARALLPLRSGLGLGGDLGIYTSRGVMAGPAARYTDPSPAERWSGSLSSGYIQDRGDRLTDLLGRPIPADRGHLAWQHQQRTHGGTTVAAQLNWWSDSEVLRDFRPRAFFPVQVPDSFVEVAHPGPNSFLTFVTRLQPNRFHAVQERLPELRFDALPTPLALGVWQRGEASYARLREHPPGGGPRLAADRIDAYYGLSRPWAPTPWFSFTPVLGGRLTHYANVRRGEERPSNQLRLLGETGFDAALRLSGTFDIRDPVWKLDGLRHLLTPRLSYRHFPGADRGRGLIPRIDRQAFNTYLPPLGLGETRHLDDLRATRTFRLGLGNLLQTRDPAEGVRELLRLELAGDLAVGPRPAEGRFAAVHTELSTRPTPWMELDALQVWSARGDGLREFNTGITLREGDRWSLRWGNNFLRRELEDYSVDGRARLREGLEFITRLQYDARRRRFNEQTYGLAFAVANTWLVTTSVSVYSGRKRESSFGFDLRVDALRF